MPRYKCPACKLRLHRSGTPTELDGELCPECGLLLEPVAAAAELVGFRAITPVDQAAESETPNPRRPAGRVDEFLRRRAAILERDRFSAENWVERDTPPAGAAVALPPPETAL
jgi:hypothetical protein